MSNSYDILDLNKNFTDRVGSLPILHPKGKMGKTDYKKTS